MVETDHKVKKGAESWAGYFKDESPYRSAKDWFSAEFALPQGQFQKGLKLSAFTEILGSPGKPGGLDRRLAGGVSHRLPRKNEAAPAGA